MQKEKLSKIPFSSMVVSAPVNEELEALIEKLKCEVQSNYSTGKEEY